MFLAWDKQTAPEVPPCDMSGGLLQLNKNSSPVCLSSSLICHPGAFAFTTVYRASGSRFKHPRKDITFLAPYKKERSRMLQLLHFSFISSIRDQSFSEKHLQPPTMWPPADCLPMDAPKQWLLAQVFYLLRLRFMNFYLFREALVLLRK